MKWRTIKFLLPAAGLALFLLPASALADQETAQSARQEAVRTDPWFVPEEETNRPNPVTPDEDSIERGKEEFKKYCVTCHGRFARGDGLFAERMLTRPPDLTTVINGRTDGNLAWKISRGQGSMPGWHKILRQDDIWNIVNYLRAINVKAD